MEVDLYPEMKTIAPELTYVRIYYCQCKINDGMFASDNKTFISFSIQNSIQNHTC